MKVLLICEGASDIPMIVHIQRLAILSGYPEPEAATWTSGRRLSDKVLNAISVLGDFDLVFVHRDADRNDASVRYAEIRRAMTQASYNGPWVGIVPVRMTETWLVLDQQAIRNAVRKPSGTIPLALPTPAEAERLADPKSALENALLDASETRGRRRDKLRRTLPELRRRLLENLPIVDALAEVPSWARFRDDTLAAFRKING